MAVIIMNPLGLEGSAAVYLFIAMLCLVIALRFIKRALVPIGPLLQAIAATAVVTLAVGQPWCCSPRP